MVYAKLCRYTVNIDDNQVLRHGTTYWFALRAEAATSLIQQPLRVGASLSVFGHRSLEA